MLDTSRILSSNDDPYTNHKLNYNLVSKSSIKTLLRIVSSLLYTKSTQTNKNAQQWNINNTPIIELIIFNTIYISLRTELIELSLLTDRCKQTPLSSFLNF